MRSTVEDCGSTADNPRERDQRHHLDFTDSKGIESSSVEALWLLGAWLGASGLRLPWDADTTYWVRVGTILRRVFRDVTRAVAETA